MRINSAHRTSTRSFTIGNHNYRVTTMRVSHDKITRHDKMIDFVETSCSRMKSSSGCAVLLYGDAMTMGNQK